MGKGWARQHPQTTEEPNAAKSPKPLIDGQNADQPQAAATNGAES
jgi:hypothetical protein